MILSLIYNKFRGLNQVKEDYPDYIIALLFFVPIVIGIIFLLIKSNNDKKWSKGIFPLDIKFTRDNLIEAHICLAAKLIQKDINNSQEKIRYVASYFEQNFSDCNYDFRESLAWSFRNPIDSKTVMFWIRKHIHDREKRMEILCFLAKISLIDGKITNKEKQMLIEILPLLSLSESDLEKLLNQ